MRCAAARGGLSLAAEQFQSQRYEVEAESGGDHAHQFLVLGVLEFDHLAGLDIDQMMMVAFFTGLIAGAAAAEIVPFQDAFLLEQADRAIDRRDGDVLIELGGAAVQFLDIRMIARRRTARAR